MPESGRVGLHSRQFQGLLWSQALGAFNDNAFKTLIALTAVTLMPGGESARWIAMAGAAFILPFLFFSPLAGDLADKLPKKKLIVLFKGVEVALMALTLPALATKHLPALVGLLFLMGAHSAFFGPVKLAILPEMLKDEDLSHGNGLLQMSSFLGIILGTAAAGILAGHGGVWAAAGMFVAVAVIGLGCSLLIADPPAAAPDSVLRFNALARAWESLSEMRRFQPLWLAAVGSAYFWFLGAVLQMNLLVYGRELMGVGEGTLAGLQIVTALGIALGSYAAGRLSRGQVEPGLVPLGALMMVGFAWDLAFAFRSEARAAVDLFFLGAGGGFFMLPLSTFLQQRSPPARRGRFLAAANILSFAAILTASAALWSASTYFKLHAGQVFLVVSVMTAAVAAFVVAELPEYLVRLLTYPVANLIYRIEVEGRDAVPAKGPALLVANHVSFLDPAFIGAALPRPVRFIMFRTYYDLPVLHWFFKLMRCIPVSDKDGPKALLRSFEAARDALRAGEVLCLFGEGEITRHGQMQGFRKGLEWIVRDLPVPIVPVHLDRVWGSLFSFQGGRILLKRPRQLPYPVTVSFGAPMPSSASAHEVRQRILELGADAFKRRLSEKQGLALEFLREAKCHPFRLALGDSTGRRLGFGRALVEAWLLGKTLDAMLPDGEAVGVLLPPCVPAALVNIGLALHGRVPVNLNYTTSPAIAADCAKRAGIRTLITSRAMVSKLGWDALEGLNYLNLEEAAAHVPKSLVLPAALGLLALPRFLAARLMCPKAARDLDATATILFTSGSTGKPKGVMLTHANLLANIESLGQVYDLDASDRILGALPFFHSFGLTGTLWFPLLSGCAALYHTSPLEPKAIGALAREGQATVLLGTPTFLGTYVRRIPPEDFKTLRLVVSGAEALRPEIAAAFKEKYGIVPLQGYGATELSPVAAVSVPDVKRLGVRQKGRKEGAIGRPLPGVQFEVVSPDSGLPLKPGEPGLVLVKGPNVMKGYLGDPAATRDAITHGFYRTGDIGTLDDDGFLTITDRLSRFSKIGGEMVPHIRIEEKLHELAKTTEQTFVVTAVADDKRGERLVVLYKEFGDLDGLLKALGASDLPKLWLPAREDFHKVEAFPLLGTGKLDLAGLKAKARELEKTA